MAGFSLGPDRGSMGHADFMAMWTTVTTRGMATMARCQSAGRGHSNTSRVTKRVMDKDTWAQPVTRQLTNIVGDSLAADVLVVGVAVGGGRE